MAGGGAALLSAPRLSLKEEKAHHFGHDEGGKDSTLRSPQTLPSSLTCERDPDWKVNFCLIIMEPYGAPEMTVFETRRDQLGPELTVSEFHVLLNIA